MVTNNKWNCEYKKLNLFIQINGHFPLHREGIREEYLLHKWATRQRTLYFSNKILLNRKILLEQLKGWRDWIDHFGKRSNQTLGICKSCNIEFKKTDPQMGYCDLCRFRKCKNCNKEFKLDRKQIVNDKWGKYCSKKCMGEDFPETIIRPNSKKVSDFPKISKQWHFVKNGKLTPNDLSSRSSKKVWWQCDKFKNHVWLASPNHRMAGEGCTICRTSYGERKIENILNTLNIRYIYQYRYHDCRNKLPLPFDFALNINNSLYMIEYQGDFHYKPKKFWNQSSFEELKKRDAIKEQYCKSKNIPLLIIPYWEYDNLENIIINFIKEKYE